MTKKQKDLIKLIFLIILIIIVIIVFSILSEKKKNDTNRPSKKDGPSTRLEIKERTNIIDNDQDGIISFGDEINLSNEQFYVIKTNEETNTVILLAKYNLNIGNNHFSTEPSIQKNECQGYKTKKNNRCTIAFSNSNYWETYDTSYPKDIYNENSVLYEHISNYIEYLTSIGHKPISGSILNYEQYKYLSTTCQSDSDPSNCSSPSWLTDTTYWTAFALSENDIAIISSQTEYQNLKYNKDNQAGIRPVIVISAAEI